MALVKIHILRLSAVNYKFQIIIVYVHTTNVQYIKYYCAQMLICLEIEYAYKGIFLDKRTSKTFQLSNLNNNLVTTI